MNQINVAVETWKHDTRPSLFRVQIDGDNESVKTEDFRENENENHSNEQTRLLGCSSDPGVANDADGVTCGQTGEADGQTGAQMNESPEKKDNWILRVFVIRN